MSLSVQYSNDAYSLQPSMYSRYSYGNPQSVQDEKRAVWFSETDPWGYLLYLNQIGSLRKDDRGFMFLQSLCTDLVHRIEKTGKIPPYTEIEPSILENRRLLEDYEIPVKLAENAWKGLAERIEEQCKDYQMKPDAVLRTFRWLDSEGGDIVLRLAENFSSDYPFRLEVNFLLDQKNLLIETPIKELENLKTALSADGKLALQNLHELFLQLDWLEKMLFDKTIYENPGFSVQQSLELSDFVNQKHPNDPLFDIPAWFSKRSSSRFTLNARLNLDDKHLFSADSLISMRPSLTINGETLSEQELEEIANSEENLKYLKGKWVFVNKSDVADFMKKMKKYNRDDLNVFDALRLESGLNPDGDVKISVDEWLNKWLTSLRNPSVNKNLPIPSDVTASLYTYQQTGYSWLDMMRSVNLGACLADDMGLGKTLQVLTLLDHYQQDHPEAKSLAIVPASLLVNWKKEALRFTPSLKTEILHGSSLLQLEETMNDSDAALFLTTYNMARKMEFLDKVKWDYLILDEAQAIKNPNTKQTRAVKKIPAAHKIALTGTPIENDLSNLWSIFDFLNKGLLGSYDEFKSTLNWLKDVDPKLEKLHNLIKPFLLRRMKSDKSIIPDLPDKLEKTEYVSLSKKQTALYLKEVKDLEQILKNPNIDRITRAGRVLASLTHFKQICNHPDQFTGKSDYKPNDSGKFDRLKDICEIIKENHECVLVFTQYKEIIPYLQKFLTDIFGHDGLVIHGSTPVKKRQEIVDAFNEQKTWIPFMVLSLKAGGTGLNLTQASHVIHFDRWWNPAVENQATDRAYRIGQKKNVIVHKLVTEGTLEEHIDELIESKKELAENVIGSGADKWITEMDDKELLKLVRLG